MKTTAYVWASGLIDFTTPVKRPIVPDGALPILTGPDKEVRKIIGACARLAHKKPGYRNRQRYLVPGIPEADMMGYDPVEKLREFKQWVNRRLEGRAA